MAPDPAVRAKMQVFISVTLLVAAIGILVTPFLSTEMEPAEGLQKIAAGWIGAVIGYWLD